MNERIEKLAEQAGIVNRKFAFDQWWHKNLTAEQLLFAELIVRECADICINKNVSNIDLDVIRESGKFTLQDIATKSCGENLSKLIKKHFGVEE